MAADQDASFLLSSIVILIVVGLGQIVYGIILIPIVPAISVKIGVACFVGLGIFFVILGIVDYINPTRQSVRE